MEGFHNCTSGVLITGALNLLGCGKKLESMDLGRWECRGKGEHGDARSRGRKSHGMGKGIQIGRVSGCKSLALQFIELLGSAGLASPELQSHIQSN